MTPESPKTTRDERRRGRALRAGVLALLVLSATCLAGSALAGTATAQSDGPTVQVGNATTTPDGTTTVDVVLADAADGLSGYYLELSVEDASVARIQSANYPETFGMTSDPVVGPDDRTVRLEAADVEGSIEPGTSPVTLATVELAGASPGEVVVSVDPLQFDSDDGAQMEPATDPGRLAVTGDGSDGTDPAATDGGSNQNATDAETVSSGAFGAIPVSLAMAAVGALALLRRRDRSNR